MALADAPALAALVAAANKAGVARALNLVEDRRADARQDVAALLAALGPSEGGHRVGLTGPPGVGKSTLAAALARELRSRSTTVGVVAVDPSSLRSGGALLGDRARMGFDPSDDGVFVRSLATGGEAGGLSYAAHAAVRVLARAYETVLVETTGVGQTEIDVVDVVDTVVLVIQPGSGDVLQFLKAGVMEIPDILVVNKADHEDTARRAVADLHGALSTAGAVGAAPGGADWRVPVLLTSARDETGVGELADALAEHRGALGDGLLLRRRAGELAWARSLFLRRHGEHGVEKLGGHGALDERITEALDAGASPLALVGALAKDYLSTYED